MSIFGNIQNASISQSGPKLPDGFDGICEVVKTTVVNGFNGQAFVAEMVVHETNLPAEAPVGYRPSWTANFKHANTAGNILCFLGSACGIDPKTQEQQMRQSITPQMCDFAVSDWRICCSYVFGSMPPWKAQVLPACWRAGIRRP